MMQRPERFTEQAQEILAGSQRLVQEYAHPQWDVEHVFLALVQLKGGVTEKVFNELGVDTDLVVSRLTGILGSSPRMAEPSLQIYATPRVARLLENAEAESQRLSDEFIGSDGSIVNMIVLTLFASLGGKLNNDNRLPVFLSTMTICPDALSVTT